MKYESNTKHLRNLTIIKLHRNSPELSLKDLGTLFRISKQRVCFILQRHNLRHCSNCYHFRNGFCSCREVSDMVDPCIDWYPKERGS